ncbi:hypothetical protein Baya_16479 [Bagarius yarrelli]|uniref:Uncharacterized protein n=1 Tax=Bagarius yarrelli TaxID=175774 RepID=A0A556VVP0_BAGYA|nr:hypothetical protein Baya_16479 [Bagarius yarrelli]
MLVSFRFLALLLILKPLIGWKLDAGMTAGVWWRAQKPCNVTTVKQDRRSAAELHRSPSSLISQPSGQTPAPAPAPAPPPPPPPPPAPAPGGTKPCPSKHLR